MTHEQTRVTVLVVDDEPSMADLIRLILQREGYVVTTALESNAALQMLSSQRFDYVLSDYLMPGLDGIALHDALRSRGDLTRFILMTSLPLDRVRAQCPTCNGYLQKPFTIDALLAQLK